MSSSPLRLRRLRRNSNASGAQTGQYREDASLVVGGCRGAELHEDARDVLGDGGLGDDESAGEKLAYDFGVDDGGAGGDTGDGVGELLDVTAMRSLRR